MRERGDERTTKKHGRVKNGKSLQTDVAKKKKTSVTLRDALRPSRRDVCNALGLKGTRGGEGIGFFLSPIVRVSSLYHLSDARSQ